MAPTRSWALRVLPVGAGRSWSKVRLADQLLAVLAWAMFLGLIGVFLAIVGDLLRHGWSRLDLEFFFSAPRQAGRSGGIAPILISTLLVLVITMVAALPIGVATAIVLAEFMRKQARYARLIRFSLDVLAGVPSIVFGLFGNAFFCKTLGLGFSLLSGGLTLACMVLPLFIRTVEAGLRAVPDEYRFAALALSYSPWATLGRIIVPAAAPAIAAGFALGLGRAAAETAALIFTSGYVDRMPWSLLDSGRTLAVHIYDLSMNVPGGDASAYASGLSLVLLLLLINGMASYFAGRMRRGGVLA